MAINVYLTLFKKYNASQLKSLEWKYHLMCYGCPFLVALVYVFIDTASRGRIYGSAVVRFSSKPECLLGRKAYQISAVVLDIEQVGLSPHCNMLWPRMVRESNFNIFAQELKRSTGSPLSPRSQST
jgi:hypothetical protein